MDLVESGATVRFSTSGGLNNSVDPAEIASNELQTCLNWDYSDSVQGKSRPGHSKYNPTRFKDGSANVFRILGLTSFQYQTGAYKDIFLGFAGGTTRLYQVAGGTHTLVSWATSVTPGTSAYPYNFATIGGILIGVNGLGTNFSWNGTGNANALGIAAPGTTCTVAEGAAGAMTGTSKLVVCFYDSTYGVLSAPSVASTAISVSSKKLNLSAIPTSTNPRADQRKIYLSGSSGQEPYRLALTIADNSTTSYTGLNVTDSQRGIELVKGGQPPNCRIVLPYRGTLWLFNNPSGQNFSKGYYSQPGEWESFIYGYDNTKGWIDFGTDGGAVTGAYVLANQLVVISETKISHVTGDRAETFGLQEIAQKIGQRWVFAGTQIAQEVVFAAKQAIFRYDTTTHAPIENDRKSFPVSATWDTSVLNLDGQTATDIGNEARMAHNEDKKQVWFSYRDAANAGPNTRTLVWNYKHPSQAWSVYDFGFDVSGLWMANYSNKPTLMFATDDADGFIFKANVGSTDRCDSGGTLYGTATGGSATTLTHGTATFYTTGDGLRDAYVRVWQTSTGYTQIAKITSNTGTQLTVASWPTFTPVSGDTYAIGCIEVDLKTGRESWGEPELEKRSRLVRLRMEDA